jgi:hypothetical protein
MGKAGTGSTEPGLGHWTPAHMGSRLQTGSVAERESAPVRKSEAKREPEAVRKPAAKRESPKGRLEARADGPA